MKLIDKDALVAEIEKGINGRNDWQSDEYRKGYHDALIMFKKYLLTLKVKEVDLEKELDSMIVPELKKYKALPSLMETAKHFFELGLKAKDWKKERMEECSFRKVGCTMYKDKILECNGACSWVVDYPKLKELKAQKGE